MVDAQRGLALEARCSFEQPPRVLHAEHTRQLAVIAGDHQRARQIPALHCHQEQELQRRDRAVDGRRPYALHMLIQLEAADIVRRRGVGGKRREAFDVANVVLPRAGAEAPHVSGLLFDQRIYGLEHYEDIRQRPTFASAYNDLTRRDWRPKGRFPG